MHIIKLKEDKIVEAKNAHNYPNHQQDIIKEQAKLDNKNQIRNAAILFH